MGGECWLTARGLITTKQRKPRPVASAAPHPIIRKLKTMLYHMLNIHYYVLS